MNAVRPYIPLIGFVVPTVVVGYGFVIPRSCIAGVNELTVGFGATILGAVVTYIVGQRAVLPKGVCTKPPVRVRIARAINRQASSPSGLFGRILGFMWPREHGRLNTEVLDVLDVRPGQRVLEIGSGTGHALREAARRSGGGHVLGVDVSELMANLARSRNRPGIARGEVDVRVGDIAAFSLDGATFDRIFSVHCIYFWRDVDTVLVKLAAALTRGGKLVLAFRPDGDDIPERFRDPTYGFPRVEDLEGKLRQLGLETKSPTRANAQPSTVILVATAP
jgi:SAM-dependent methyltransferase